MSILLLLAIGLLSGVLGGLFGIGGGILIVPALIGVLGYSQHKAQGTSLVALLAPVGLFALMNYYRAGNVDFKSGAWIAGGFMGGAYVGSLIAGKLDELTMRRVFAVFLVVVAFYLFTKK